MHKHLIRTTLRYAEGGDGGATSTAGPATADTSKAENESKTSGEQKPTDDDTLGEGGKKALTAERTARAAAEAEVKALRAQVEKIEQAGMSDLEKAQKTAEDALAAAAKATADAARYRLATEFKLDADDAALFLTGADEAAMRKQAERLAARDADRRTDGTYVARAGYSEKPADDDGSREFLRQLTGQN